MQRLISFDIAKAICIILVVIGHYVPAFLPEMFCLRQFQNMLVYFMFGVACCDWKSQLNWLCKVPSALVYLLFVGGETVMLMEIWGANLIALAVCRYRYCDGSVA